MKLFLAILKLSLLIFIVAGLPMIVYFRFPEFFDHFKTMEGVNAYLEANKTMGMFVYLGLQIIQIVISIIPGQFIQVAGGFAFGFWISYLLSIAGIFLGSSIAFGLARTLGRGGVHLIFGEERMSRFISQLNSRKAFAIVFMVFLVPGLPKDLFTYAAGVSDFKYKPFMILALVARTPSLMVSLLAGAMINNESYIGVVVLVILTGLVFMGMSIKRKGLTTLVDKYYQKFNQYPEKKRN